MRWPRIETELSRQKAVARADRAEWKVWNGKLYIVTLKPAVAQVRYANTAVQRNH